ncbi:MAG: protoporphyrinogen oxidase [Myxococcales bacterium]|nr:protoporphyrinogen oxidase [Myxococcales bacterium]MCB9625825.1 protoporphyrinogen oxidase [Sandaracinaceae bacterium]
MSTVVVGGGLGGLACAHRLLANDPRHELLLLEASDRLGGLVTTECVDGYVIERGPESMITTKPAGVALAHELGLGPRLLRTRASASGAYVVTRGRLERIPAGFSILAPTDFPALLRSPVLSPAGKLRALADMVIPARVREDDSLAAFVRRRFGQEVLDRLAQPLAGGIYGADPEVLSLRSTMPRFLDAEQPGGVARSLARAARESGEVSSGARYGLFVSLPRGMQELTDTLSERVRGHARLGARVTSLEPDAAGYRVRWEERGVAHDTLASRLVLALPSQHVARLVEPFAPGLSNELAGFSVGSAAAVTLALPLSAVPRPLDAYGFVVPAVERRPVLACTFSSAKWDGRAPDDVALLRVFFGGYANPRVHLESDERLLSLARDGLREWLGITRQPELVRVDRYLDAMPRYHVGHAQRVARIEAQVARLPGLQLVGGAYHGVGMPDVIASAERAVELGGHPRPAESSS